MNSKESTLQAFNKAYTSCVTEHVQKFIDAGKNTGSEEFCVKEKKEFYSYMA